MRETAEDILSAMALASGARLFVECSLRRNWNDERWLVQRREYDDYNDEWELTTIAASDTLLGVVREALDKLNE